MTNEKTMYAIPNAKAPAKLAELNCAIIDKLDPDTIQERKEATEMALKEDNTARMNARVAELLDIYPTSHIDFWTEYVNNPMVTIGRLVQDTESLEYSINPADKYLSFGRIEKAFRDADDANITLAESPSVYRMIAYFVDNLGKILAGDLSDTGKGAKKVTAPTFNYNPKAKGEKATSPDDRKTLDFSKRDTESMITQLNNIAKAMFPAEYAPMLRRKDYQGIKQSATGNKLRNIKLGNEAAFLENFFEAVRVRKNDLEYKLTSAASCHKVKTEDSANKH